MPTPSARLVAAAALVDDLARPTRLLAARRTGPPALAGRWELPGGKVEQGEEPLEALRRELVEELHVEVTVGAELVPAEAAVWPVTPGFAMRVWWCSVRSGEPSVTLGHDALRWLTVNDLDDVDWLDGDLEIVEAIRLRLAPSDRPEHPPAT